ncbi:MAG: hypothetical protein IJW05_05970 [Lentisphaeria bacterium]|nr:hypothetical protein [Lentisphaeria bacterium]
MKQLMDKLKPEQKLTIREIRELFQNREIRREEIYPVLAKKALDIGENFYAYDIAEKIVPQNETVLLQRLHIMALALARSGAPERASEILQQLPELENSEIVGLKSRILKDVAASTNDAKLRKALFRQAAELSLEIFQKQKQYYNGINSASCFFMAGEKERAKTLVLEQVLPSCREESVHDLWWIATMGECHLLTGELSIAGEYYKQAAELAVAEGKLGSFSSTLKQFYMLAELFDPEAVRKIVAQMKLPNIAVFSGHMIDSPERMIPRFPADAEEQVREKLAEIVRKYNIRIAYVSCACGGDILFIEEVLKNGGECFILPPVSLESTIRNSVDIIPGADWRGRLEKILQNDNVVLLESECEELGVEDDVIIYDFSNRFLFGAAILRAEMLHFPLCGVSVWNGEKSGMTGGTDSAIALWKAKGIPVEIVTPEIKK